MRYSASEKFEIIELVEQSSLSIRRTLAPIGNDCTSHRISEGHRLGRAHGGLALLGLALMRKGITNLAPAATRQRPGLLFAGEIDPRSHCTRDAAIAPPVRSFGGKPQLRPLVRLSVALPREAGGRVSAQRRWPGDCWLQQLRLLYAIIEQYSAPRYRVDPRHSTVCLLMLSCSYLPPLKSDGPALKRAGYA
jgi:hypothetical protein